MMPVYCGGSDTGHRILTLDHLETSIAFPCIHVVIPLYSTP